MIIGIIGAGNVGLSLAMALTQKGRKILILSDHYEGPLALLRRVEIRAFLESCGTVVISVRDKEISETADRIASAGAEIKGKVFLHTAGALDFSVLAPLREKGARIGVMHPIQSFPRPDPELTKGIYFGVSGDQEAVDLAEEIARALGSRTIRVKDHALYHAACVMSAGFIATLIKIAGRVISAASDGDWRTVMPMANGTLKNIEDMGPDRAMTGPQVRGDLDTAKAHSDSLRVFDPGLALLYNLLSAEMTEKKDRKELDPALLEVLACPKCKGELEYRKNEDALLCHSCRLMFRIDKGIPIMLIEEAEGF